ncbi:MAG: hypothetical protein ABMB14_41330, partial [Myxococcota bacterium]
PEGSVSRLLAIVAGLLAILLVPLALSGPTALLCPPAHLALAVTCCIGSVLDGLDGWPERARRWGFFYLVASIAMVAALELGADVRSQTWGYWGIPWVMAMVWGWIPPVVAGMGGMVGEVRQRRLTTKVVRHRRRAA